MDVKILNGGKGSKYPAQVSKRGQLVVGPLDFGKAYNTEANVINTAFNLVPPLTSKKFVITDLVIYANKAVGASDARVELYEADDITDTTVSETLFLQEMVKQTRLVMDTLNILVNEGKWINVKTDDNTVFVTVVGYYVDA